MVSPFRSFLVRVRDSELARQSLFVFTGLLAANVLQFLFYSLVSRAVGVEEYGVVTSLLSATQLFAIGPATVACTVVARLSADLRAAGDPAKLRRLGDLVTVATAIAGGVAFVGTAAFAVPIAAYLHFVGTEPVILTGIVFGLSAAVTVQRGLFMGSERFGVFALSNIADAAPKVLICPFLASRFGVDGALVGIALALMICWSYNVIMLRRFSERPDRLRLDIRRIVLTSASVSLAVLAVNALLFYDVILVRHYFSGVTAGLYGAAALVARSMYTVIAFIPAIVLPKAAVRRNLGRRTTPLLIFSTAAAFSIVGVSLVVNVAAPRLLVSVLAGRAFGDAGAYVFAYTFALGALGIANVVAMYKIGLHRFDFVAPLLVVAVAEIVTVVVWHRSVHDVLIVLCAGHLCALGATLVRFRVRSVRLRSAASPAV